MNCYVWKRLENLTSSYHSEGGVVVVAEDAVMSGEHPPLNPEQQAQRNALLAYLDANPEANSLAARMERFNRRMTPGLELNKCDHDPHLNPTRAERQMPRAYGPKRRKAW